LVRTIIDTDIQVRYPAAVQWIENINWPNA
jgi:hypothetical protein